MKTDNILICGSSGMVGSSLYRIFYKANSSLQIYFSNSKINNLMNYNEILSFIKSNNINIIIDASAKVGGIMANKNDNVGFLYDNIRMGMNLIHAAAESGTVEKLIFLGSSCIYPKFAKQPITPDELLNGKLEETNEGYALAKITCIKLCQYYRRQHGLQFISLMPCNLFGYNDNYNLENAHVIPNLIRKFDIAKENNQSEVMLYGDGTPLREFLFADDLAKACYILYETNDWTVHPDIINVGSGKEISIEELANIIKDGIEYEGKIIWNTKYPNGTPRKLIDSSYIRNLGWEPENITFEDQMMRQIDIYRHEKIFHRIRI